jgi:phosphoglycolate phosphatase-like HAD superfamily hydrolase
MPDREILGLSGVVPNEAEYKISKLGKIEDPENLALDRLQPGVMEALDRLALRYRIVLVTLRHSREALDQELKALGIAGHFEEVLSGPAGGIPGWKVKCGLVEKAGIVQGKNDFFAGDTETDIVAGKSLGITTVAVCNGIRNESFLRALSPDWIVPTLPELLNTALLK